MAANSDSSRVSGLVINRFHADAIYLLNPSGVQIDGNYIGTDVTGTTALPNHGCGIIIQQEWTHGIIVGGPTAAERNVISGNHGDGVAGVNADYGIISSNYIVSRIT